MNLKLGCVTETGNYREKNQDRVICRQQMAGGHLLAVSCICDGIGSLKDSEIAAEIITSGISNWLDGIVQYFPAVMEKKDVIDDLEFTIRELNELVCEYIEDNQNRIGCTMSLILLIDTEYCIFHVGDSRIYCLKDEWLQMTQDEVILKQINGREKKLLENYIGKGMELRLCKKTGMVPENAIYVLGTDGLYKRLEYEDVMPLVVNSGGDSENVEQYCRKLIDLVLERGERDNVSCAIIKVGN